jgi:hypothetical protein
MMYLTYISDYTKSRTVLLLHLYRIGIGIGTGTAAAHAATSCMVPDMVIVMPPVVVVLVVVMLSHLMWLTFWHKVKIDFMLITIYKLIRT